MLLLGSRTGKDRGGGWGLGGAHPVRVLNESMVWVNDAGPLFPLLRCCCNGVQYSPPEAFQTSKWHGCHFKAPETSPGAVLYCCLKCPPRFNPQSHKLNQQVFKKHSIGIWPFNTSLFGPPLVLVSASSDRYQTNSSLGVDVQSRTWTHLFSKS